MDSKELYQEQAKELKEYAFRLADPIYEKGLVRKFKEFKEKFGFDKFHIKYCDSSFCVITEKELCCACWEEEVYFIKNFFKEEKVI